MKRWTAAICLLVGGALCSHAEDITLRFTSWDGDVAQKAIRKSLDAFEKAHPGVKVQYEYTDYNSYFSKLLVQYSAGVAPDVAMTGPDKLAQYARRGAFLPLDDFANNDKSFDISVYYPAIVQAAKYKDVLYSIPRDVAPYSFLYYNKRIFKELGIPEPDGTWTWDYKERPELKEKDFLWVLGRLQQKKDGKVTRYPVCPWWIGGLTDNLIYSQGLKYCNDPESPTKLLFNSPEVVKTHEFLYELIQKKYVPSPNDLNNTLQTTGDQLFMQQKSAMYLCGIWDVTKIRESLKPGSKEFFDWDITTFPAYAGKPQAFIGAGATYSIVSSTKHPKEAWELVKWVCNKGGMDDLAAAGVAQPAVKKLAQSSPWIPGADAPIEQRYPKSMQLTDLAVDKMVMAPTWEYWSEMQNFVNSELELAYNGSKTMKQALNDGQKNAERRLAQIQKQQANPEFNWPVAGAISLVAIGLILWWVYAPEKGKKLTNQQKTENRSGHFFIAPWLIGMAVFTLGPMLLSMFMSFADWDIITPAKFRGVGNFTEAFTEDPKFWGAHTVTAIYTAVSVPLGICTSLALALLLNVKVRGIPLFRTLFYLPALSSAVAASLVWKKIFQQDGGVLNMIIYGMDGKGNFLGLATLLAPFAKAGEQINWIGSDKSALLSLILMAIWGAGGGTVILLAGLQGIPQFYYEAAEIDGAKAWQKFKVITLPLLTPSLFFSLITGVIGSFQVFTQAFVMTGGGPGDSTRFFVLHLYDQAFKGLRMGYASSLGWILFFVVLIFTLLQFKLSKYIYYEAEAK